MRLITTFLILLTMASTAHAAPTNAQKCESDVEKASAKYAQCRLNAESTYSKTLDAAKRTASLTKCSDKLTTAFSKATTKYGVDCPVTEPSGEFDAYLTQCSDDAAAAAGGAALPDYVGDLSACNADLTTCDGDLTTCSGDLATCSGDLATCTTDLATAEADLATTTADLTTCDADLTTCEALPPARLLKTGQTTSVQAGDDGDFEKGVARSTYTNNGDGTLSDTSTGLMWELLDDNNADPLHDKDTGYMWPDAFAIKIAALNAGLGFAGHTDWRLPNILELQSIVNYELAGPAVSLAFNSSCTPACTAPACSCTASSTYWSSSNYASAPTLAWSLNFNDGFVLSDGKSNGFNVRAVRGGA